MNDQNLKHLLQQADDGMPPVPRELAERARGIVRRRRFIRSTLATSTALLAIGSVAFVAMRQRSDRLETANARRALVALNQQAQQREHVVSALESAERRATRKPVRADPLGAISQQRERAALILIANESYQKAIDLFPDTQAAKTAMRRLDKLGT